MHGEHGVHGEQALAVKKNFISNGESAYTISIKQEISSEI